MTGNCKEKLSIKFFDYEDAVHSPPMAQFSNNKQQQWKRRKQPSSSTRLFVAALYFASIIMLVPLVSPVFGVHNRHHHNHHHQHQHTEPSHQSQQQQQLGSGSGSSSSAHPVGIEPELFEAQVFDPDAPFCVHREPCGFYSLTLDGSGHFQWIKSWCQCPGETHECVYDRTDKKVFRLNCAPRRPPLEGDSEKRSSSGSKARHTRYARSQNFDMVSNNGWNLPIP